MKLKRVQFIGLVLHSINIIYWLKITDFNTTILGNSITIMIKVLPTVF